MIQLICKENLSGYVWCILSFNHGRITFILPKLSWKINKEAIKLFKVHMMRYMKNWRTFHHFFHLSFWKVLYESVLLFIIKVLYKDVLLSIITCHYLLLTCHTQKYFIKTYYYLAKTWHWRILTSFIIPKNVF